MKTLLTHFLICISAFLFGGLQEVNAQEDNFIHVEETMDNIKYSEVYLNARIKSLDKYIQRSNFIQKRLIKKMKSTENDMAANLSKNDSITYKEYVKHPISYDYLILVSPDSVYNSKGSPNKIGVTDSLKKIQQFLKDQYAKLPIESGLNSKAASALGNAEKLQQLEAQLAMQDNIQKQLDERAQLLKTMFGDKNVSGIKSLEKAVYYSSEKRKAWKQLSEDPDAAEEKALEYLNGIDGFDKYINTKNYNAFGGLGNQATAEELARLGFQTKDHTQDMMQQKFGPDLGKIQGQMTAQLQRYQDKLNAVNNKIEEEIGKYKEAPSQLKGAREKIQSLPKTQFKINPLRSLPFKMRLKYAYNFQTLKVISGQQPAILQLGTSVIYRQTEKWRLGLGMTARIGLGENWQNLHLSYEGVQFRAFTDWDLGYGFKIEGGFEQMWRPERIVINDFSQQGAFEQKNLKNAFEKKERTAYLGVMKSYRINKKWNGTFMGGYDFLCGFYNKKTPWIMKFGWEK